jgi:hypothetical protein
MFRRDGLHATVQLLAEERASVSIGLSVSKFCERLIGLNACYLLVVDSQIFEG